MTGMCMCFAIGSLHLRCGLRNYRSMACTNREEECYKHLYHNSRTKSENNTVMKLIEAFDVLEMFSC